MEKGRWRRWQMMTDCARAVFAFWNGHKIFRKSRAICRAKGFLSANGTALAWLKAFRLVAAPCDPKQRWNNTMIMQKAKWFALGPVLAGLLIAATPTRADESETVNYRPFTLSVDASTLGFGVSAGWRFHDHFGVHAGVNYFGLSKDGKKIEDVSYNTDLRLLSEPIALDIYPWASNPFRVSVGVLLNQNQLKGVVPQDPVAGSTFIDIGGTMYDSAAIGNLNLKVEQAAVSPFLSVGTSLYLDKAKHWSLNGELGVAYTGSPDVALSNSGPGAVNPADLAAERRQIEDKMDDYKFYPILKVSLSFSF